MDKSRGVAIYDWIKARHADGLTVYAATPLRVIVIAPKHASRVRVKGEHCEVQMGKRWDSINWCQITAR